MPPSPQTNLPISCCQTPEITVDAPKMQGLCKTCKKRLHGPPLIEFLLDSLESRCKEVVQANQLLAKYERVILSNSVDSLAVEEEQ